jgi:hypothetical protein
MLKIPRFDLGQMVITARALTALRHEEVIAALGCHVLGDWGEVAASRFRANEAAVLHDGPVVSAFESPSAGEKFFVLTTGDRSLTTVFLSGENA